MDDSTCTWTTEEDKEYYGNMFPSLSSRPLSSVEQSVASTQLSTSSSSINCTNITSSQSYIQSLIDEACTPIAIELEAIEIRRENCNQNELSLYFSHHNVTPTASVGSNKIHDGVVTARMHDSYPPISSVRSSNSKALKSPYYKTIQQVPGEAVDEVDQAFLTCEYLFSRAKTKDYQHHQMPLSTDQELGNFDSLSILEKKESELSAKSEVMHELMLTSQASMAEEARGILAQQKVNEGKILRDLKEDFESKKTLLLIDLREKCEAETKTQILEAKKKYITENKRSVAEVHKRLLEHRERLLAEMHTQCTEQSSMQLRLLERKLHESILGQKEKLQEQLQKAHREKVAELEAKQIEDLRIWEEKEKFRLEKQLFQLHDEKLSKLLQQQEAKTSQMKLQLQQHYDCAAQKEFDKLRNALSIGTHEQLQQFRRELEKEHEKKIQEMKKESSTSLQDKLFQIKQTMTSAHNNDITALQAEVESNVRMKTVSLHEQLQSEFEQELETMRLKAKQKEEDVLNTHRKDWEEHKHRVFETFKRGMESDLAQALQKLQDELDTELDLELKHLQVQEYEKQTNFLEERREHLNNLKHVLLQEGHRIFNLRGMNETDGGCFGQARKQLLIVKGQIPSDLTQNIEKLVMEFSELTKEHSSLLEKFSECSRLYLSTKRKCGNLEQQVQQLQNETQSISLRFKEKTEICQKLHAANEVLLAQLSGSYMANPKSFMQ